MWTKITLALALALAVSYAVPASAGPTTCGHATMQYDSSGTWTGPYCERLRQVVLNSVAPLDDPHDRGMRRRDGRAFL